jgi:hypothetical protein
MIPRTFHKFYADVMGYFWFPCPVCGEPFGGHELDENYVALEATAKDGKAMATVVCPKEACKAEAVRRNMAAGFPRIVRS